MIFIIKVLKLGSTMISLPPSEMPQECDEKSLKMRKCQVQWVTSGLCRALTDSPRTNTIKTEEVHHGELFLILMYDGHLRTQMTLRQRTHLYDV